jgi:hypothetical protein
VSHIFDFNKVFNKGINYCRLTDREKVK